MIPGVRLDRNGLPTYGIGVAPIAISCCILASSLLWTWIALRAMRRKPVVQQAGMVEPVPVFAFALGAGWILLSLVSQVKQLVLSEEPIKRALSVSDIRLNVWVSVGLAVVVAAIYSIGNKTKQENQLPALRSVSLGFLGFLAGMGPVLILMMLLQELVRRGLLPQSSSHELLEFISKSKSPEAVFWVGASAVVAAPLLEELLYRVILQGELRSRMSRNWSVVVVAVVFCVVHGWPSMVGLLPLAIVLGVLYDRTNSYLAVVTTHAVFNMSMLLLTGLQQAS